MLDFIRMRALMKLEHRKQWDKQKVMANATKITTTLTGMPRGTDNHSKVEDGAIDIALIDNFIEKIHNEQDELWQKVVPVLQKYEADNKGGIYTQRNAIIIRARYKDHLTIEMIADAMNLTTRRVIQILQETERIIESLSK